MITDEAEGSYLKGGLPPWMTLEQLKLLFRYRISFYHIHVFGVF